MPRRAIAGCAAAAVLAMAALAGCSGDEDAGADEVRSVAATTPAAPPTPNESPADESRCVAVAPAVARAIATGLEGGPKRFEATAAVRSRDYERAWMVAGRFRPQGSDPLVGVWVTNDVSSQGPGLVYAVDPFAEQFSDWGDGDQTDAGFSANDDGVDEAKACLNQ